MEKKEIKTTSETEEVKNVYVSADGLEFDDETACKEHEKHLFYVLKEHIRRMAVKDTDMHTVFAGEGNEDNEALVLVLKSSEEVDTVRELLRIRAFNPDKQCERVQVGKALVLGFSYDDDCPWVTDLEDMIQNATNGLFKVVPAE